MKMVGDQPGWVTPEDVALVMLDLVQKEEYVGGTVIEIGATVRKVEAYDDPGPVAGGNFVPNDPGFEADMWKSLEKQFKSE